MPQVMEGWQQQNGVLCLQAQNPKDQYLLLKALNEALVSLAALPPGGVHLSPQHQQEVCSHHD